MEKRGKPSGYEPPAPVHFRHQEYLTEKRLGGGVADVVGDLHGGWDMTVPIAAGRGDIPGRVEVPAVAQGEARAPGRRVLAMAHEPDAG